MSEELLLTPREAAALLKVSYRTMAGWRRKNHGPSVVYIGRTVRYSRREIEEYVEKALKTDRRARELSAHLD